MKICLMDSNSYPVGQPREAEPFGLVDCKPHDAGELAETREVLSDLKLLYSYDLMGCTRIIHSTVFMSRIYKQLHVL